MRALLVVNPRATSTTSAGREVLAHALASELKLDVLQTRYRGHAAEATASAVRAGVELVIAHGGDGTVNEVVNGMLEARPPFEGLPGARPDATHPDATHPDARHPDAANPDAANPDTEAPLLAVLPGGSANVFARALGLPRDPLEATSVVLHALADRRTRTVGLGRADDRWFTFNAGMGWDAEVVASVERSRARGLEASPARYARTALREYLRQRRHPSSLTIELPGEPAVSEIRLAVVCNTDPWTYLGPLPARTNPGCGLTDGLALFALRSLSLGTVLPVLREILRKQGDPKGPNVLSRNELPLIRVISDTPVALQVDGDYLGERSEVEFVSVPGALRVVV